MTIRLSMHKLAVLCLRLECAEALNNSSSKLQAHFQSFYLLKLLHFMWSYESLFWTKLLHCNDHRLPGLLFKLSETLSVCFLFIKSQMKLKTQCNELSFNVYMLIQIEYEIPYIVIYLKLIVIWHNSIIAYSGYLILYRHTTISIQFAFNCRSYFPLKQATLSKARKTFVLLPEKNRIERLNLSDSGSQWGKWA